MRRTRGLPGGRAVVGALLVAASAVAVFAAYLGAVAAPDTHYLVARAAIEPGTRLATADGVADLFELRPLALDEVIGGNAVSADEAGALVGQVVVVPLAPGDLLLRSGVVDAGGVPDAATLSFSLDAPAALAGQLRAGERVDVLATYGSGESAWTTYVVRGVPVIGVTGPEGSGLGAGRGVTLTVAVSDPVELQALVHAVHTADVVVTRSIEQEGTGAPAPGPYRPSADAGPPDEAAS